VSNHGGRQLDSCPSAISRLPIIRDALGKDYPLLFDSGIRTGDDIIKALALGANFIMIGRPILYSLGAGGQNGLDTFVTSLSEEVSTVMAQLGLNSISEINKSCIAQ
jgi:isopentenyl diphosphate isomerase/L-lactate dehydrogenase-like FMN-dependent dehydrogenase